MLTRLFALLFGPPFDADIARPIFRSRRAISSGPMEEPVPEGATARQAMGARLRSERRRLRLSQTALAEIGGVTKGTQINYEAGKRSPDTEYLVAIHGGGADILFIVTGQRAMSDTGAA
jgi:DNA-binding XRE family transcriptional regulator